MVLVGHHGEDGDRPARCELDEVARERRGSVRVVRGVEDHGRRSGPDLEPSGRGDLPQHPPYELDVERCVQEGLDGRDRHGGVLRLVVAVQGQREVDVLTVQAPDRNDLTGCKKSTAASKCPVSCGGRISTVAPLLTSSPLMYIGISFSIPLASFSAAFKAFRSGLPGA